MRTMIEVIILSTIMNTMAAAEEAGEKRVIAVETTVYQFFSGNITGNTSLTDDVYQGIDRPALDHKTRLIPWVLANPENNPGAMLKADHHNWRWDGEEEPVNTREVKKIMAPRVRQYLGQPVEIAIRENVPVFYFEKRPDKLFDLKHKMVEVGMTVDFTLEAGQAGRIVLRDLTFTFNAIGEREPIEGVPLEVGAPITTSKSYTTSLALKPGLYYGLLIYTEGHGQYIIRVKVDEAGDEAK